MVGIYIQFICQGGYMNTFYVDESGSMTKKGLRYIKNQYFVICVVHVKDEKKLKRVYKRFISSNLELLKKDDKSHNMFYKSGKFKELKGAFMSCEVKKNFANFFCQNDLFSIYYICSSNQMANSHFYQNKARAFNYLIRLCVEYNSFNKNIKKDYNFFHIDERNVSTKTIATLEEYLNIELVTAKRIQTGFTVRYFHSENNELIQVADVFSNIYYSYIVKGKSFDQVISYMRKYKYIKNEFYFPFCC